MSRAAIRVLARLPSSELLEYGVLEVGQLIAESIDLGLRQAKGLAIAAVAAVRRGPVPRRAQP